MKPSSWTIYRLVLNWEDVHDETMKDELEETNALALLIMVNGQ